MIYPVKDLKDFFKWMLLFGFRIDIVFGLVSGVFESA